MDSRNELLQSWAREVLQELSEQKVSALRVVPVSGDASFRRYFRAYLPEGRERLQSQVSGDVQAAGSCLLVDAPPEHENCRQFVNIAEAFHAAGLRTPVIHAVDYERGFMMLQDFGDTLYLGSLQQARARGDQQTIEQLYQQAISALLDLQCHRPAIELPLYDKTLLRREMVLFEDWFCGQMLELTLDGAERALLHDVYEFLEAAALSQSQVCVHRDYHSRNLMLLENQAAPGIIDFQDAVLGPYTYDLMSLLRDCYIVWPQRQVYDWVLAYSAQARRRGITAVSDEQVRRDFDLMGLQRHLKVLGIFCRLYLRDDKSAYLADIPTVVDYVMQVAPNYPELSVFVSWMQERILSLLPEKLGSHAVPVAKESR